MSAGKRLPSWLSARIYFLVEYFRMFSRPNDGYFIIFRYSIRSNIISNIYKEQKSSRFPLEKLIDDVLAILFPGKSIIKETYSEEISEKLSHQIEVTFTLLIDERYFHLFIAKEIIYYEIISKI